MSAQKKRLARLTREESQHYAVEFGHYLSNVRNDSKRADRYAWRQCVKWYPRLAAYQGAKP